MPNLLKSVGKSIKKVAAFNVSSEAPAQVKSLLQKYGNEKIVEMSVGRKPITSAIRKIVNIITDVPYDDLFHLFIIVKLENGVELKLERNQRVNFTTSVGLTPDTEIVNVPIKKDITLGQFVENGNKRQGNLYWKYSASSNNCQDFVIATLSANGLLHSQLRDFIKQDTKDLLPNWVAEVADTITDAANSVDKTLSGGGMGLVGYGNVFIKI